MDKIPYPITHSLEPENQESPIHFLNKWKTPIEYFYIRNHFQYPTLTNYNLWLKIHGTKSFILHYNDLLSMPSISIEAPLECSGNKRAKFSPKVYGEQWKDGALSQGVWKGVPLAYLLQQTEISPLAKEVVFKGADFGTRTDMEGTFHFKRSLPIEKALHPHTIVAYEFNNKPLTFKHGYPFRLIVPNWYGMASVKWLQKIEVINDVFIGPFQTVDYVYYPYKDSDVGSEPVTIIHVNSTIQSPLEYSILDTGTHVIKGIAWSGMGEIIKVEVSTDNGSTWNEAILKNKNSEYAWSKWSFTWDAKDKGEYTILSRATDETGRVQPNNARWNRKGYGYNAVSKVHVKVE